MEKLLKKFLLCGFFLSLLISSSTVLAATIKVPGDYLTIQAGIDAASGGDTVMVADGTYKGIGNKNLLFNGKAITVRSENGPKNCVIDLESNGSGFNFHFFEGKNSVVSGFTITNGYMAISEGGGGISCINSSPTITNCIISGNKAYRGGGISCYNYSSPTITNCVINGNDASEGGGISCYKYSSPSITNCTIVENMGVTGGGINCDLYSTATITNCTISNNEVSIGIGGGISCSRYSSPTITNCIISNNMGTGAGGITCTLSSPTITNSIVVGNAGGGIECHDNSSPTITNCTISGNGHYGISISGSGPTQPGLISGSGATNAILISGSSPTITNCIFWENGYYEIYIYIDSGLPTITYCDVQGGYSGEGNIDSNPLFIGGGDYHLTASSPCIDAGTSIGAPTHDIDGDSRPQDTAYDIGADEFIIPLIGANFSASKTSGTAPLMVNFTDQSFGTVNSWNWSFGDGLTSKEQNPSHTYNNLGSYTVTLSVTGPEGSDSEIKTDFIKVRNAAMPWIPLLLLDD